MTDTPTEETMEARLERIEQLVVRVLERLEELDAPPPSPGDVLSLEEAARYLGVAPRTLRERKAGTKGIPRYRDRPAQFVRSSLDRFKRERIEREARSMSRPAAVGLVRRRKIRRD